MPRSEKTNHLPLILASVALIVSAGTLIVLSLAYKKIEDTNAWKAAVNRQLTSIAAEQLAAEKKTDATSSYQPTASMTTYDLLAREAAEAYWFENYVSPRKGLASVSDAKISPFGIRGLSQISFPTKLLSAWEPSVWFASNEDFSMSFQGDGKYISLSIIQPQIGIPLLGMDNVSIDKSVCPEGTPEDVLLAANYARLNDYATSDICSHVTVTDLSDNVYSIFGYPITEEGLQMYTFTNDTIMEGDSRDRNSYYYTVIGVVVRKDTEENMLKAFSERRVSEFTLIGSSADKASTPVSEIEEIVSLFKDIQISCEYICGY